MYRSKTLRKMTPTARRMAKTINEAEQSISRLKKLIPVIQSMESEVIGWDKRQEHYKNLHQVDPLNNWPEDSMLSKISKERGH